MPYYKFKAINKSGKEIKGLKEAKSIIELKKTLTREDLIPIEIIEVSQKNKSRDINVHIFPGKKISSQELSLLLHEIGLLLNKGVHITQIFDIISHQIENQTVKEALLTIKTHIQEGKSIGESIGKTSLFPEFLVEMVKAGEESGTLDKIFISASEYIDKQNDFRTRIINSLIYPSIVIIVGFLALIVIMNIVVPTITNIYSQFGKNLPLSTQIVVYISNIFSTILFKILPVVAFIMIIFRKKIFSKKKIDQIKLKIPFFKNIYLYSQYSNWSNTLSLLLKGGLTIDKALLIANKTISNSILKSQFNSLINEIKKGKPLSQLTKEKNLLPDNAIQLIKIGEETGQLDDMFNLISEIYKKQTEKLINTFLSYLEPLTLIVLSIFIGFFVFATLLPIFNLNIK